MLVASSERTALLFTMVLIALAGSFAPGTKVVRHNAVVALNVGTLADIDNSQGASDWCSVGSSRNSNDCRGRFGHEFSAVDNYMHRCPMQATHIDHNRRLDCGSAAAPEEICAAFDVVSSVYYMTQLHNIF